jgi:type II restriction/modification system DNA methylase subunit YeeA
MLQADAALFELPFEFVKRNVLPDRSKNNRENYREKWWLHAEPRPGLRKAMAKIPRYIATPRVAKHRFFTWVDSHTIPDSRLFAFGRADDYCFGVLQSRVHAAWSFATSSRHGDGDDGGRLTYNGASTFDTFPFPWPPGKEPSEDEDARVKAIAEAARELVRRRDAWLNPPGASEDDLKQRTLTKLYNLRAAGKCEWLENAHRALDQAVFAAYGWPAELGEQEILARLLRLNQERAAAQG